MTYLISSLGIITEEKLKFKALKRQRVEYFEGVLMTTALTEAIEPATY
jgi:hypothetical protein